MKIKLLILFVLLFFVTQLQAGIRPSFSLDYSAWNATHIVVATEGEEIDGNFRVLEPIKGDLGFGEIISIPNLADFKSEDSRQVKQWHSAVPMPSKYVTGTRIILFLKQNAKSKVWESADAYNEFSTSVVWVEGNETFSFIQTINPGPSILVNLGQTESDIRNEVYKILEIENSLNSVLAIENLHKRAEELEKFATSEFYLAKLQAFDEFPKCGESALPVLRKMLNDKLLLNVHTKLIETLTIIGGAKVGNELTEILKEEIIFWRKTAPTLKKGWWNKMDNPEIEILRDHYEKALEVITQLTNLKYKDSKKEVIQFRKFWRSFPQLEDSSGLNQMSEECDEFLIAISPK